MEYYPSITNEEILPFARNDAFAMGQALSWRNMDSIQRGANIGAPNCGMK